MSDLLAASTTCYVLVPSMATLENKSSVSTLDEHPRDVDTLLLGDYCFGIAADHRLGFVYVARNQGSGLTVIAPSEIADQMLTNYLIRDRIH